MTEASLPSTLTQPRKPLVRTRPLTYVGISLAIALLAAPYAGVYPVFVMKILCFALFAASFNLLLGYTGLLSFGHAAFFGGAGYVAGYAAKYWQFTTEASLLVGVLTAVGIGLVMGVLAIRRLGIYFAMITLALAQMFFFICLQTPHTGGEDGLQGVPRGSLFGTFDVSSDLAFYYVVVVLFVGAMLLVSRIVSSPFGQLLRAVKENEGRAISLGYSTDRFKLLAFVLSAGLAGLAGSMKALVLGFATLSDVHWTMSGAVILMTLVGGMGTLSGPVVGALIIVLLENKLGDIGLALANVTGVECFASLGESVTLVTGVIFILCVLGFRRGVVGALQERLSRRNGR